MPWQQAGITRHHLEQAMECCDRLGLDAFRRSCHPGFKAAKGRRVTYQGRGPYEPRPLMAAAYSLCHPQAPALGPKAFSGDAARQALLRDYGFALEETSPPPAPPMSEGTPEGQALSAQARTWRDGLRSAEARIEHLEQRLAMARTARAVYLRALLDALPAPAGAPSHREKESSDA